MADDDEDDDFDEDDDDSSFVSSDDDDDDDTDDGDAPRGRRRDMADTRSRGGRRGGGSGREIDISSDPAYVWRLIGMMVSSFANDVGKMGYKLPPVTLALGAIQTVLGPQLTSFGINALAAAIQNPEIVKRWVRALGWPEQINALGDEFIDDFFEGLRMALRDDKVDVNAAQGALKAASSKLLGKADRLAVKSVEDAYLMLDEAEQLYYEAMLLGFSADERKTFDLYTSKLANVVALKALVRRLENAAAIATAAAVLGEDVATTVGRVQMACKTAALAYLQRIYGEVKPSDKKKESFLSKARAVLGEADKAIVDAIKPDVGPDPVVDALDAFTARLRRKRGQ